MYAPGKTSATHMPNPKQSSLSQRKQASQERAGATVSAIVEAAARILASDGAEALTTNRVAIVAGVSIGSVYQYFPNKEAIVVALIDHQLRQDKHLLLDAIEQACATAERQSLSVALRAIVAHVCVHQHRLAPLLTTLLPLLSQLRQEQLVQQRMDEMAALFEMLLATRVDELRPQLVDPEQRRRTTRVLTDALRGALNAAVHDRDRLLTAEFQTDVTALVFGALLNDTVVPNNPALAR